MENLTYDEWIATILALMQKHIDRDLAKEESLIDSFPELEDLLILESIEKSTEIFIAAFTEKSHLLEMSPELIKTMVTEVSEATKRLYRVESVNLYLKK